MSNQVDVSVISMPPLSTEPPTVRLSIAQHLADWGVARSAYRAGQYVEVLAPDGRVVMRFAPLGDPADDRDLFSLFDK